MEESVRTSRVLFRFIALLIHFFRKDMFTLIDVWVLLCLVMKFSFDFFFFMLSWFIALNLILSGF